MHRKRTLQEHLLFTRRLFAMLLIFTLALAGCDEKPVEIPAPCPQLPIADGYYPTLPTLGGLQLRLPAGSHISRDQGEAACAFISYALVEYYWNQGHLYIASQHRALTHDATTVLVLASLGALDRRLTATSFKVEDWKIAQSYPHKLYPLDLYPKMRWKSPDQPNPRRDMDPTWGIRGTKDPMTEKPFLLTCGRQLPPLEEIDKALEEPFLAPGKHHRCQASFAVRKGDSFLASQVAIYAPGGPELDGIVNAVARELTNYLQ